MKFWQYNRDTDTYFTDFTRLSAIVLFRSASKRISFSGILIDIAPGILNLMQYPHRLALQGFCIV
jgi:hypothetical protein